MQHFLDCVWSYFNIGQVNKWPCWYQLFWTHICLYVMSHFLGLWLVKSGNIIARVASCTCCHFTCCQLHVLPIANLSNLNKKSMKQKQLKKSLKYRNLSIAENGLYKPSNWIKSSVSSMTSAEEGQSPSNEPEEWQDTHPLST